MTLDLRPLSIAELFDRAFVLYRRHFRLFVGIAAFPGAFFLLLTILQQAFTAVMVPDRGAGGEDPVGADTLITALLLFAGLMLAMMMYYVTYMIALAATTFAVSEIYVGRPATIAEAYTRMRGRIGALVVLLLLVALRIGGVTVLGFMSVGIGFGVMAWGARLLGAFIALVPLVAAFVIVAFMSLRYSLSIPALVLEGLRPGDSIRRSIELTRGRLGRVFLMILCASMVTYAALMLFQGPFMMAALFAGPETSAGFTASVVGGIFGALGTTVTAPFMIIGLALIYYDARIREEGFDLELSLAALDAR